MYNKVSCKACGSHLTAASSCNVCKEPVSWSCSKCDRVYDVTHMHSYPRENLR